MKRLLAGISLTLVLVLALPLAVQAQEGTQDGRVIFGGNFTLESNEIMRGDLVLFGGNATLEETSELDGSVVIFGGNAVVAAQVTEDLIVIGGNVDLLNPAVVGGDVVSIGGNVDQAEQAVVEGDFVSEDGFEFPFRPTVVGTMVPDMPDFRVSFSPLISLMWFAFRTLLISALAVLVVMFWPDPTETTADAVLGQPLATGGLGLLTFLVAPVILIMLLITILLSPISLLGAILLIVAAVYGWIAIGLAVGNRLATSLKWEMHAAAAAGLGTLLLTFVVGGFGLIPCIGWVAPFIVASLGLGAVILTRFGSQPYAVSDPVSPGSGSPSARGRKVAKKDEE